MEVAVQALRQGNVGVVILQETKFTDRIHMRYDTGYFVWVTEAESQHFGGGAEVW